MMPKMPKTDSIQKLAAFWQRHDLTDFEDDLEEVSGPVFRRAHVVGVPLTRDELKALRKAAADASSGQVYARTPRPLDSPGALAHSADARRPAHDPLRRTAMRLRILVAVLGALLVLPLVPPARAQNALVVSVWGGNWKNTVESVIGKAFTAKTGIPVEYEVGGTIDRLAKARVAKGNPLVDLNFTTTHVARLYISDGLYAKLDMAKLPNAREIAKEAFRSDFHLGVWAYVYTIVYRPDLVKEEITKWSDLWKPSLKGKIAMPDFDPSHIITIAALMEGGDEVNWQKGEARLKQLKDSVAAFYSTDAQSQDLMKTGQGPVQVMLSVNAYHLQEQGIPVKLVQPADYPGIVGIDTMAVMAGTKRADAAHHFINFALSKEIQTELVKALRAGPVNLGATVPANLKGQPGIFVSTAEWKQRGYIMNDDARAKNLPGWREWFTANIVKK
jgi:putative spermidine/putrescine transport system substrate-binding protein